MLAIGASLVLLVGGYVQVAALGLYGDLATTPSFPSLISRLVGERLARPFAGAALPASLRAAYARALAHRGDDAGALAIATGLPSGSTRSEILGIIDLHRGDAAQAVRAFIAAGDAERAQGIIDARDAAGDLARATQLEGELSVAALVRGNREVRARTLWRLGVLQQHESYVARDAPTRTKLARAALASYLAALELAPNDETFLLAAASQNVLLGDRHAARDFYARALEAVPDSADARAGLVRTTP